MGEIAFLPLNARSTKIQLKKFPYCEIYISESEKDFTPLPHFSSALAPPILSPNTSERVPLALLDLFSRLIGSPAGVIGKSGISPRSQQTREHGARSEVSCDATPALRNAAPTLTGALPHRRDDASAPRRDRATQRFRAPDSTSASKIQGNSLRTPELPF
jgi:hypothetical protein